MRTGQSILAFCASAAILSSFGPTALAHKPITSPFTFYDDVLPITRAKCGRCHAPDGIAPMSLLSHESAVPWGESIKLELVAGHMPPWGSLSPADRFQATPRLTARELNVLLTWAAGGTPSGDPAQAPDVPETGARWPLGQPDAIIPLPEVALPAETATLATEAVLAVPPDARRLAAVDLLPGAPSVVRSARVSVRPRGTNPAREERLLTLWVPGDTPARLPRGSGWTIPPDSELVVRLRYRKRWDRERELATDQSRVGLYFAAIASGPEANHEAAAFEIRAGSATKTSAGHALTGEQVSPGAVSALAIWPEAALAGSLVRVETLAPAGTRMVVATFDARAGWERRYWLAQPLTLEAGTRVQVTATWPPSSTLPVQGTRLIGIDVLPRDR